MQDYAIKKRLVMVPIGRKLVMRKKDIINVVISIEEKDKQ